MKPKKYPKADLRRRWFLFLQIGLILVLFLTLQAFQWKTYDQQQIVDPDITYNDIEEETPPVTVLPDVPPPLPPPKTIVDVIKEVPDDKDVEEDNVAPTEIDLDDLVKPSEIEEPDDVEDPVHVPFDFIEDVPVFPGCESLSENEERRKCMGDEINRFVRNEFDTTLGEELGLTGMNLVVIRFVVNRQGEVDEIKTRATHPGLEKEAERVIGLLPKMQPGKQRGKPVPVSFTIPIRFQVLD
ncbi:energy transducer TonB [Gramella jeungdoensis]|uniref:Energy transducer TonB n=1 Tax=Gramella jeungdoensis TaxID=708091 RepID=A0ABT0YZ88_9FLAO|nr:energy transducer TonB [Gramella jeungdoensis]MCM8568796.1 energy transducer TonB [Gramella jeungdoensis]